MRLSEHITARERAELNVFSSGVFSCNPTILKHTQGYICLVKGVNFEREQIYYDCAWRAADKQSRITCIYKIVRLDERLNVRCMSDLDTRSIKTDVPFRVWIEDLRLFHLGSAVMVTGTYIRAKDVLVGERWIITDQRCQVFIAQLSSNRLIDVHVLESPSGMSWDKNWSPCPCSANSVNLIANVNTGGIVNVSLSNGKPSTSLIGTVADFAWRGGWSGSTGLVPFQGGYLAIVHAATVPGPQLYRHMFIYTDTAVRLISEQIQLVSYLRSIAFGIVAGKRLIYR